MSVADNTTILLDKMKVLDACIDVQDEVFRDQRAVMDRLVERWSEEISYFFGLFQSKPATDPEATLAWLREHEPAEVRDAELYRSGELGVVQSIGHLILASEDSVKRISVSAEDFIWLQDHYDKNHVRTRDKTIRLMRRIARGYVPKS